jgi:DNA-binding response OmpR family regulator
MTKILIVDDDRNLANLTKIALVTKGFEVSVVHESLRVIEELKKQKPDLILMDIMMPKLSGGELVKLLRKDINLKHQFNNEVQHLRTLANRRDKMSGLCQNPTNT